MLAGWRRFRGGRTATSILAKSASPQPTMKASVPAAAAITLPETGAGEAETLRGRLLSHMAGASHVLGREESIRSVDFGAAPWIWSA